ncbi:MAG: hypothetical protein AAF902_05995 [Chloroflexota bacterium]
MFKRTLQYINPSFDPTMGNQLAAQLLTEARQGQFETALSQLPTWREGKWDERGFYIDLIGQYANNRESVEKLPDTALGNLIRGAQAVHYAWDARGAKSADQVHRGSWNPFFERLKMARQDLERAIELDSKDPTPYSILIRVGRGLQLGSETSDSWFDAAVALDPLNQQAHVNQLTAKCKKWRGGTHAEMFDFARDTVEKAPNTSTLNAILFLAYHEQFLYSLGFDNDIDKAYAELSEPMPQEETIKLYNRTFGKIKRVERVSDYWSHNMTLFWFYLCDNHPIARQELAKVGPYCTEMPWAAFFETPIEGFKQVRRALILSKFTG